MINLGVSPVDPCVKVDDTTPGIEEGLNAGMWTVGLAMSGNAYWPEASHSRRICASTRSITALTALWAKAERRNGVPRGRVRQRP